MVVPEQQVTAEEQLSNFVTLNNGATVQDDTWLPLLANPPYPDYPSGLCGLTSAGMEVLADYFGENSSFVLTSDSATMTGVTRSFGSFSAAAKEYVDARIFSGIHFRFADEDAIEFGKKITQFILANACLPLHGKKTGHLK